MLFKNLIWFCVALLCLAGCGASQSTAAYSPESTIITELDMYQGKWLLYTVNAPFKTQQELYTMIRADFKSLLGNRLTDAATASGLLLPAVIPLNPSSREIKDLYIGTGQDYFINIKAQEVSNDLSSIDLANHHAKSGGSNTGRVTLEVYDLKNAQIIYSQNITGVDQVADDDNRDFHTHEKAGPIIIECYKLVIEHLKKNIK